MRAHLFKERPTAESRTWSLADSGAILSVECNVLEQSIVLEQIVIVLKTVTGEVVQLRQKNTNRYPHAMGLWGGIVKAS